MGRRVGIETHSSSDLDPLKKVGHFKKPQKSLKKEKIRSIFSILDPPRYYSTDLFRLKSPKSRSIRVMLL